MDTKLVISDLMVDMLKQFSIEDRGKRERETQKGSIQKVLRVFDFIFMAFRGTPLLVSYLILPLVVFIRHL